MNLSQLQTLSQKYGGPYKLLILHLLGGQLIGALLALSCYAWLISTLHTHDQPASSSDEAIVGIATAITVYILAWMPATWYFFSRPWFGWISIAGDVLATAGSIAIAVLTRVETADCRGLLTAEAMRAIGVGDAAQACKLQKVVFATGVCNSIMFPVNLAVWAYLKSRWYRAPSTVQDAEVSAEKD